jgi:hypothetical protein
VSVQVDPVAGPLQLLGMLFEEDVRTPGGSQLLFVDWESVDDQSLASRLRYTVSAEYIFGATHPHQHTNVDHKVEDVDVGNCEDNGVMSLLAHNISV